MANPGVFPGLGPTRAEFDNNTILNAPNPDPLLGYAHGPIPNNNPGWKPAAYTAAIAAGNVRYDIKAADIAATLPPNPAVVLNKENTGVCDIVVNPPATPLLSLFNMRRFYQYRAYTGSGKAVQIGKDAYFPVVAHFQPH